MAVHVYILVLRNLSRPVLPYEAMRRPLALDRDPDR